jgi:hypothetical protein
MLNIFHVFLIVPTNARINIAYIDTTDIDTFILIKLTLIQPWIVDRSLSVLSVQVLMS